MEKNKDTTSFIVDLGLKNGATDIVANLLEYEKTMIRFSKNEITVSKNFRGAEVSIFLMIGKQRASSTIPIGPKKVLSSEVNRTLKIAKISQPADIYSPLPQGPFNYDRSLLENKNLKISFDKLVNFVEKAINSAIENGAKNVAGSLIATNTKNTIATSGDINETQKRGTLEISVRAFLSDQASGHFVSLAQNIDDFKPDEAGKMAGEVAKAALEPKQGQAGIYTALLGPLVFADLINQIGILSSAFLVDAGQSFLLDKIGSHVASEKFTLSDDPTIKGTYGMRGFDDEGIPVRKNVIVENGLFKTYLHNSTTAKKFKSKITGNAGLISPHPWNLVVDPGTKKFEELLVEIDNGIYVTNDWYLRYQNYLTGDFSTIPRDGMFLIKKGHLEGPIKDLRISDNMLRIFKNIRELSTSRYWVKWWEVEIPTFTPYALIDELKFTKSTL